MSRFIEPFADEFGPAKPQPANGGKPAPLPKPGTVPNPAPGGGALPKVDWGHHAEPAPAQHPDHSWVVLRYGATACLILATFMCLAIVMEAWHGRNEPDKPTPAPTVNARAEGHVYAVQLDAAIGESFKAAKADLVSGHKPLKDVKAEHAARWKKRADALFDARFVKPLGEIIPDGTEKPSDEQRRRYAEFLEAVGAGMGDVK